MSIKLRDYCDPKNAFTKEEYIEIFKSAGYELKDTSIRKYIKDDEKDRFLNLAEEKEMSILNENPRLKYQDVINFEFSIKNPSKASSVNKRSFVGFEHTSTDYGNVAI